MGLKVAKERSEADDTLRVFSIGVGAVAILAVCLAIAGVMLF